MIKVTVVTMSFMDGTGNEIFVSVRPDWDLAVEEVVREINSLTDGSANINVVSYNGEFAYLEINNVMDGKAHSTYYIRQEELL